MSLLTEMFQKFLKKNISATYINDNLVLSFELPVKHANDAIIFFQMNMD